MAPSPYYEHNGITVYHGDCLDVMAELADQSIDAVIADPPFGATRCAWDSVIPFDPMWRELKRIVKPRGAIVLFGAQPFTSGLVMSNPKWFRHEWIWRKNVGSNFANVHISPMREHENILVFSSRPVIYIPQLQERAPSGKSRALYKDNHSTPTRTTGTFNDVKPLAPRGVLRFPSSVQKFNVERGLHPTQKPLALMAYLIKTYTCEGDTILDFTMGSGTTLRAAKNLQRRAIGIDIDESYCKIAVERLSQEVMLV